MSLAMVAGLLSKSSRAPGRGSPHQSQFRRYAVLFGLSPAPKSISTDAAARLRA